ncbi:MAG: hypothetical protein GX424_02330 [Clostridiales bacterium]|nr:hypothetical protein [Clostridiales bacterium]
MNMKREDRVIPSGLFASAAVMLVRGIGVIAFFTVVMPLGAKRMRFSRGFRERMGFFAFQDGDVDGTLLHSVSVHFFQNQIRVGRRHFNNGIVPVTQSYLT